MVGGSYFPVGIIYGKDDTPVIVPVRTNVEKILCVLAEHIGILHFLLVSILTVDIKTLKEGKSILDFGYAFLGIIGRIALGVSTTKAHK